MGREVRRVPLDYKHPTEPNPYWAEQKLRRIMRGAPEPRLHAPDEASSVCVTTTSARSRTGRTTSGSERSPSPPAPDPTGSSTSSITSPGTRTAETN